MTKAAAVAFLGDGLEIEIVPGILRLAVSRNTGGIFGFMPGAGIAFFLLTAVVVGAVAVWAWRSGTNPVLLGMIAGGGIGNLFDRVIREPGILTGGVVDFIDFSFWPSFNLADSAISVGVVLLLAASRFGLGESSKAEDGLDG